MANAMTDRPTTEKTRAANPAGPLWFVQALSGLLLILVLLVHMVAHHFVVEGGLRTFDEVIAYVSNPVIFTITIIFLVVVTTHALLGLRAIILDLGLGRSAQRIVNLLLTVVGLVAIVYGIWLEITVANM